MRGFVSLGMWLLRPISANTRLSKKHRLGVLPDGAFQIYFLISAQPVCDYQNIRTVSTKTNYDAFSICNKFNRIKPGSILIGAHFLYILGIIIHLYIAKVVLVASLKL
jgi:hypothetical protein